MAKTLRALSRAIKFITCSVHKNPAPTKAGGLLHNVLIPCFNGKDKDIDYAKKFVDPVHLTQPASTPADSHMPSETLIAETVSLEDHKNQKR